MTFSALSHGDGAPGAGAETFSEDCITSICRFWWVELGRGSSRTPLFEPKRELLHDSGADHADTYSGVRSHVHGEKIC